MASNKSMLLEAILGSQVCDSSGETLIVSGADCSDLEEGRGLVSYEHKGSEGQNNGQEIVGRVIFCKKIYGREDCENDGQRACWDQVKAPLIYGIIRLFDSAGNEGAKGLAAQVRDAVANNEKILVRWSVEGTTLQKEGNKITSCIIRRMAATTKPCNRTCDTRLLSDPQAPEGFEKEPDKDSADVLGALTEKHEHPMYQKLGGSIETECSLLKEEDLDESFVKSLIKIKVLAALAKATEAGCASGAPSTLSGGACLQREDLGPKKRLWKEQAFKSWHEYDKKNEAFDKSELASFLKHQLPEVDPDFLDRFSDLIDDYKIKVGALHKADGEPDTSFNFGANVTPRTSKLKAPPKQKKEPEILKPLTKRGAAISPVPAVPTKHFMFDEKTGTLHTPRGSFEMYIPSRDTQPGAKEAFDGLMNDPKTSEPHDRAMENWSKVHQLAMNGKLPSEIPMHAALMAAFSANCTVPVMELMHAYTVDLMRDYGVDARDPNFSIVRQDFLGPHKKFPKHSNDYFKEGGDKFTVDKDSYERMPGTQKKGKEGSGAFKLDERGNRIPKSFKGDPQPFSMGPQKFGYAENYHNVQGFVEDLTKKHKIDGRAFTRDIIAGKKKIKGQKNPNDVAGIAQKTGRYMAGLMGMGNAFVPDTHMVRYLFGLEKRKDESTIEYLKNGLWGASAPTTNTLEAIDRYFFKNHPAVQHMLNHPKWGHLFRDDPEQAIFPSSTGAPSRHQP